MDGIKKYDEFDRMKRYEDYKTDNTSEHLTESEMKDVDWTRYKIIVPTEDDKNELMKAFEHFHNSNIDTDFIAVNQLAHEYLEESKNIIVSDEIFNNLNESK